MDEEKQIGSRSQAKGLRRLPPHGMKSAPGFFHGHCNFGPPTATDQVVEEIDVAGDDAKERLFEAVYAANQRRILAIARSYAGVEGYANLCQEILLQMWRGQDGRREQRPVTESAQLGIFSTWPTWILFGSASLSLLASKIFMYELALP